MSKLIQEMMNEGIIKETPRAMSIVSTSKGPNTRDVNLWIPQQVIPAIIQDGNDFTIKQSKETIEVKLGFLSDLDIVRSLNKYCNHKLCYSGDGFLIHSSEIIGLDRSWMLSKESFEYFGYDNKYIFRPFGERLDGSNNVIDINVSKYDFGIKFAGLG